MLAKIEDNKLTWLSMFRKKELPVSEIAWVYLQQEDVNGRFCCGNANFPIGRLVVVKKDMSEEVFQYEGMEKPKELLEEIRKCNPDLAVGYTKENRERFGKK